MFVFSARKTQVEISRQSWFLHQAHEKQYSLIRDSQITHKSFLHYTILLNDRDKKRNWCSPTIINASFLNCLISLVHQTLLWVVFMSIGQPALCHYIGGIIYKMLNLSLHFSTHLLTKTLWQDHHHLFSILLCFLRLNSTFPIIFQTSACW